MFKNLSFCVAASISLAALPASAQAPAQGAAPAAAPAAQAPAAPAAAPAGDANAGYAKTAMCQGCHEIPGWQTVFPETYKVPRIFGQHPAYIVKALQEYKAGERAHPSMRAIAASLSDKDMNDLAAYYGGQGVQTAKK
ncbi:MAG TPA: cytochrome c [Casimicrobiaceae bacterium]|nr:cytochrome c [Casimicrobiaceae bacterium]